MSPTFVRTFSILEIKDIITNARDFQEIKEQMSFNWLWISEITEFYYKKYAWKTSTIIYGVMMVLLYFTNSFYSFCPKDASLIEFSPLSIILHVAFGFSIFCFILLQKVNPGFIWKWTIEDEDNIIKKTLYLIEDWKFNKIVPESEICYDCLIKKPKHMDHCEEFNNCVEGY